MKRAARDGIALGLAVGTSGLAFGAAAVASGLSVAQACVLSLAAYTGASQFALAAAVAGGGSLIAGTASAVLLGSRNGLYGLRLASLLGFRGPFRLLAALGVTDESTAVALAQPAGGQPGRAAARAGFLATFGSLYLTWNAATLAGALGAGRLGSPGSFGLDVVGPAAFLALLWPRLRDGRTERTVALAGAMIALAATPFCPPGLPVVLAAAAALGAALLLPASAAPPAGGAPGPADAAGAAAGPGGGNGPGGGYGGACRPGGRGWREAGPVSGTWVAVLVTAASCYALKLAGLTVPPGWLAHPRAQRFASLVPVALLAALIAVQAVGRGESLALDPARLAGLGAAAAALLLRAPFLVVILAAAGTAAGLRALGVA